MDNYLMNDELDFARSLDNFFAFVQPANLIVKRFGSDMFGAEYNDENEALSILFTMYSDFIHVDVMFSDGDTESFAVESYMNINSIINDQRVLDRMTIASVVDLD